LSVGGERQEVDVNGRAFDRDAPPCASAVAFDDRESEADAAGVGVPNPNPRPASRKNERLAV